MIVNEVAFSWTIEELRVALLLCGYVDELSIFGVTAFEDLDSEEADFGMRGLQSRGLLVVEADQAFVADLVRDVARCACEPESTGLLFGSSEDVVDVASFAYAEGKLLRATFTSPGVVAGTITEGELVDGIFALLVNASLSDVAQWSLALRIQPVDRPLLEVLVGQQGLGLIEDEQSVPASEAEVRSALARVLN